MGRLREPLLERVETFSESVVALAEAWETDGRSPRVIDQVTGSGTSVGANLFEADEAMSTPDFCKCIAISLKELNETRFWIRLGRRRGWSASELLDQMEDEAGQLRRILGTILFRTRETLEPS